MATAKVKKMALGGMGGMGGIRKLSNAKPGLTPVAQKAQFQRAGTTFGKPSSAPAFAKPYINKAMGAAKPPSSGQMPSQLSKVATAYSAAKPGAGKLMKKGGIAKGKK